MASKFMNIRRIVLPIITVVLLMSQLSGCAFMSSNEMLDMLQDGQSISIEVAAPSTYTIVSEVGARQQTIDWVQLDQLSTFPEFRLAFDKQLNIERRTFNGTNTKIGCIYIDSEGDTNGNVTLQDALRNKVFMEKYYTNGDTKTAIKKLAAQVYTDVNGEDNHSFLAAFNAYYNLMPDNINPDAFNATQSLTRERFASALYRSTTPVSQDYLIGFGGEADTFTMQMGGLTDHTAMAKQMDAYSFVNAANQSLDHASIGGSITRAEAIYMVVNAEFPDQLAEVTGKEKVSYSDAKNAGDLALKLGFKVKNKETKTIDPLERWESYTLYSMLQNPDKGLQGDLYNTLVVADKYKLLDVTADGGCRWDEPISKAETIQLFINIGSAKNTISGYATDKSIGNENAAKYGKISFDSEDAAANTNGTELGNGGTGISEPAPNVNNEQANVDENGFTEKEREHYDNFVDVGMTPEEAFELIKDASPNGDNMTQPEAVVPPAPAASQPATPPAASKPAAPSQPAAPSKPAPAPSQPANNGGGSNQQLSPEEIDRLMKENGWNGGGGGGGETPINPKDEGALSAHGE